MNTYNSQKVAYFTLLNIAGKFLPMIAAIAGIPILINQLGTELFGILIIIWVIVGYSSLLDLGLPRGIIKVLSDYESRPEADRASVVSTSLTLMFLTGLAAALVFVLIAEPLVAQWLTIEVALQPDAKRSIFVIAASYPVLITLSGFRAVLESHQQFYVINKLNIAYGVLNYLLPAALAWFYPSLVLVVAATVLIRTLNVLHLSVYTSRLFLGSRLHFGIGKMEIRPLFSFSKWIILATVFAMLTAVADRFMIGSMVSMTATTFYSTPLEMLMKLEVIPMAFIAVLFPAFTLATARQQQGTEHIYNLAIKIMAIMFAALSYFLILGSDLLLTLWLGEEFASNAAGVFRVLSIGLYVLSIVYIAQTLVQGVGRPELSVLVYTILMVVGLPLTYYLISVFDIEGAAYARVFRIAFELIMITVVIRFTLGMHIQLRTLFVFTTGLALVLGGLFVTLSWASFGFSLLGWLAATVLFWKYGISTFERQSLLNAVPENIRQKLVFLEE
jgi:O-antigen/teichoic acid export membrane protein